jgi:sec-independent protein translocase protein TatB
MFDLFSPQHIILLLIVALVVVGPKDLPKLLHMLGKWAGKARAMAGEFRKSFDEMARQTELDELRKEIEALKKNNPVSDLQNTMADVQNTVNDPVNAMMESASQMPPETSTPLEGGPEPRAGEFEVTDTMTDSGAASDVAGDEPVREPAPASSTSQA